jgi:hypothetical protein
MAQHSYTERWRIPPTSRWDRKTQTVTLIAAREVRVEITVDTVAIAARMAALAVRNKSKQAREIGGAVVVRVMGEKALA